MRNPYETADRWLNALAIGISAAAANYADDWLHQKEVLPSISFGLSVVGVVALSWVLSLLFSETVHRLRWLRSLLFRRQYVEGTWIDLIFRSGRCSGIGLTRFEVDDYRLLWSGSNHNLSGAVLSGFTSITSIVEWPKVRVWCENDPSVNPRTSNEGICELTFSERDSGPPLAYHAWGGTVAQEGTTRIVGWKVTDPKLLEALHNPSTKVQALLECASKYPEFPRSAPPSEATADTAAAALINAARADLPKQGEGAVADAH